MIQGIAAFIVDRMSSYIVGGMRPETAARFTMGELGAIYKGDHYSRAASGAFQLTPPPEDIPIEAARAKANEAIREILAYCKEEAAKKARPLNTEAQQEAGQGKAPEKPAQQELSGFEKMAEYARRSA